ncbi:MAG: VWA domain-containing protein [Ignavibacteriae bacterium]|nr:MAG: VWA domain-containing protein [Ignavibacteriota bacterium]
MKKQNKITFILFLSFFVVFSVLFVSAYTGAFNKNQAQKDDSPYNPPKKELNGGPIQLSTSLDNEYYYDNENVYLYIDLKADKADGSKERTPLNISVVIDRSGSMADKNKLEYVKRAVDYIIDQADRDDYISIVTYDDYVDVLQRSSIISDKYSLREKVSNLKPGGFTNLSEGMFEGYDQVNRSYMRGYVNRVLLLSDGLANRGVTDRHELARLVRDMNRKDGITISTFGVGNDFNENLMADIADYGKGNYFYIRNSADIPEIFASELNGVRNLVGQGTKVRVTFPSYYLAINKVFGYPYDVSGNEVTIDFKDIFAEQTRSVLIKFNVLRKIDTKLSFESELTYENVAANFERVTTGDTRTVSPARSKDEYKNGNNETVAQNISVFESNEIMENALKEADDGNYESARRILQEGETYMNQQMEEVAPSPEMIKQKDVLDKYNEDLKSAETKTDEEKKEMQKSGKYDNYNTSKKK